MSSSTQIVARDLLEGVSGPRPEARPERPSWFNRFVAIGLVLMVAISVSDVVAISMQREASIAAYETATNNLARGMSAQTAHLLERIDKVLIEVDREIANSSLPPETVGQRVSALLTERGSAVAEFGSFALVDVSGDVVAGTPRGLASDDNFSSRNVFKLLRASPATVTRVEAGKEGFVLARRLTDSRGQFAGVILANLSAHAFQDFYQIAMPPRRVVTLMNEDGDVLAQYSRTGEATSVKAATREILAMSMGTCNAYFGPDILDGAPVIGSVCRFRNLPFVLETSAPAAEALALWKHERLWIVAAGIFACFVVAGLLYVFARQVRRLEISELSLAAEKLQAQMAHGQLDVALSNIIQGVCFFDKDMCLIVTNQRFRDLYEIPDEFVRPGDTISDIVEAISEHAGLRDIDRKTYLDSIEQIARARAPGASVLELGNGRTLAIQSQPLPDGGWVATHEDITERRQAEEKISFLAKHDVLTGLVNRSVLTEHLAQMLDQTARGGRFAILFIDLDRFKTVNDTLGHDVGDDLLRQVAARLQETIRGRGTISRFGGDEFVILLSGVVAADEVARLARQLIDVVSAPYTIKQQEIGIGASVGIEMSNDEPISADVMLKHADVALYLAKAQGRGVYRFFEPDVDSRTRDHQRLEGELRHAISEHQFELAYQPIFEARTGEVCAFEALLRWDKPGRGLTATSEFIDTAEESGLIIPMTEFAIREACRQAAQWPNSIRVAVNVSPEQIRDVSLVPLIQEALTATGLAPHRLELEVTETVMLQNSVKNVATLHKLRELGVAVVMDDFGAGYSSLNFLRQFPFNKVKIDRSFVRDLDDRPEAIHFVRAIVDLCRSLHIKTTASGVETDEQLAALATEGCTEIQGFLVGHPSSPGRVAEVLATARLVYGNNKGFAQMAAAE